MSSAAPTKVMSFAAPTKVISIAVLDYISPADYKTVYEATGISATDYDSTLAIYGKLGPHKVKKEYIVDRKTQAGFTPEGQSYHYTGFIKTENKEPHNFGLMWYSDGKLYEGYRTNGKKDGHGRCIWPNGNYYIGQWKDGNMHGKGTLHLANGTKKEGNFDKGAYKDN